MISVVLASHLRVIREGMKRILLPLQDIQIVAEVESIHELLSAGDTSSPQVLVFDNTPSSDRQNVLPKLREACPHVRVIVVSRSPTLQEILLALRQGVRGLLSASCAVSHLPAAIRAVSSGRVFMPENVASIVGAGLHGLTWNHTNRALTQREMEIFVKLAGGLKVSEIADQLGISVKTVSTHKGRLMEKLGISSFSQLVQYAIANGLFNTTS